MRVDGGAPSLVDMVFEDNAATAGRGGGLFVLNGEVTLRACSFAGNSATSESPARSWGGGLYAGPDSVVLAGETVFAGNSSEMGGGLGGEAAARVTLDNCVFAENEGGGVFTFDGAASVSDSLFVGNLDFGMRTNFTFARVERCELRDHVGVPGLLARQGDLRVIDSRFAGNGTGLVAREISAEVTSSVFTHNTDAGLALNGGDLIASDSAFSHNQRGVSIGFESRAAIRGSMFEKNGGPAGGGGLAYSAFYGLDLEDCVFRKNRGEDGAGVSLATVGGVVTLVNLVFDRNRAERDGGGLHVGSVREGSVTVLQSTFSGNRAGRSGGAIRVAPPVSGGPSPLLSVINSILWSDSEGEIAASGPVSVTYSDVQGGFPGAGNIDADPLFVRPAAGDLHLRPDSPARDAGIDTGSLPPTDLDGQPRIQGSAPDMGAYELPACY
ncbi:MAG: right-handed parallel beta-helix repeat-containing protein [Polyangiaceae bacterium]